MMELIDINLIFFTAVLFAAVLVMSFLMWKWRHTIFIPVDRGVPYWYNPEDDIMYTHPNMKSVARDIAPDAPVPIPVQQTSFTTSVELSGEFEETLKEIAAVSKGKKGVRKR